MDENRRIFTSKSGNRVRFHNIPQKDAFILEAVALGGRWKVRSGIWSFPDFRTKQIEAIIKKHFGHDSI